jgi:molybdopterin converting factor small subunit
MPQVTVRFFGFGSKASGFDTRTETIGQGSSLRQLWETLRCSADHSDLLARIDERQVFFLRNGELVRHEKIQETPLEEGDTVTLMVLAIGG